MQIEVTNLGKRYNRQWIFRKLTYCFSDGKSYAVTGHNGSGKSTLLQVLAGAVEHTEGSLQVSMKGQVIQAEYLYKYYTLAAPYLELIEELTLTEFFEFHFSMKPIWDGYTIADVIDAIGLTEARNKQIRYFSSGMKQRAKLGQAMLTQVPLVLLDEPTANLDAQGIALYHHLIEAYMSNRMLIVCSNDEQEISFCNERIDITHYKQT